MATYQQVTVTQDMTRDYVPIVEAVPYEKGLGTFQPHAGDSNLFVVVGSEFSEVVEIRIPPQHVLSAEPGTMVHMSRDLHPYVDIGDCMQGCKRCCCAGESCCRLNFRNESTEAQVVAFTANIPGRVVPINLAEYPHGIFFRAGAFLAAVGTDWKVDLEFTNCSTGCCGGMGFVLNKLTGSGWGFLAAGGTVMQKVLESGESILVDQNSVLAFESTVKFTVTMVGSAGVCCCGGMGLMNAKFTGPGLVIMESMSQKKLVRGLMAYQGK